MLLFISPPLTLSLPLCTLRYFDLRLRFHWPSFLLFRFSLAIRIIFSVSIFIDAAAAAAVSPAIAPRFHYASMISLAVFAIAAAMLQASQLLRLRFFHAGFDYFRRCRFRMPIAADAFVFE